MNIDNSFIKLAKTVIKREAKELDLVASNIDSNFINVLEEVHSTKGKLVFSGIGKSGLIARKISSSFRSIGVDSVYLDAIECLHGDIGTLRDGDIFFFISNSGETEEILTLLRVLVNFNIITVAVSSNRKSSLAQKCNYSLCIGNVVEADPFNKIPTTSSLAVLSLFDALLVCLLTKNNLSLEVLSHLHPGGSLYKVK